MRVMLVVLALTCGSVLAFPKEDAGMLAPPQYPSHEFLPASSSRIDISGVPGSDVLEFPEDLRFGLPCDDVNIPQMNDISASSSPHPTPSPSPLVYPPHSHIAWEVVRSIQTLSSMCGCNITHSSTMSLAAEVWKILPGISHETDTCPKFLHDNPYFPEPAPATNTPSPSPIPMTAEEAKMFHEIRTNDGLAPADKSKQLVDVINRAASRISEHEESSAAPRRGEVQMQPLPYVPEDCGDDVTGSIGLNADEVQGTSGAMNHGYRPVPPPYNPMGGHEPLFVRERLIEARKAFHDTVMSTLQVESKSSECTVYVGMRYVGSAPMSSLHADVRSECERACLFDDDCTGWMYKFANIHERNELNCQLFNNSVAPVLLDAKQNVITGLCPNAKVCSKETMSRILNVMHSTTGAAAGCPAVLERIVNGLPLSPESTCKCISQVREDARKSRVENNDCVLSANSVSWSTVMKMCQSKTLAIPTLLQHTGDNGNSNAFHAPRDCRSTALFSAGLGPCDSYDPTIELSNHIHCHSDYDREHKAFAFESCWQCGECIATPSPTPYIPPPALMKEETLPGGKTTPCLDARLSALGNLETGPLAGWYVPDCFQDGSFMPTQCNKNECWCVFDNGVEILGTRFPSSQPESANCRSPPPMAPVLPYYPPALPDQQLVIARALSKLMFSKVHPEAFCRPHRNVTLEATIFQALSRNISSKLPTHPACASTILPGQFYLQSVLNQLARCVIPEPVRKVSASPSSSPSPSVTPSISISPSSTPSRSNAPSYIPEEMCGDVKCANLGPGIRMYHTVPAGWCSICQEGTSGPCRDAVTFACFPFSRGMECSHGHVNCADIQSGHHAAHINSDCLSRPDNHTEFTAHIHIATIRTQNWVTEWSYTLASAVVDVLSGVNDLCDVIILDETREDDVMGGLSLILKLAPEAVDPDHKRQFERAIESGSLQAALIRRGMPLATYQGSAVTMIDITDHLVEKPQPLL